MDKELASKLIAENLTAARKLIDVAVELSEASGVMFELPWGGEGSSEAGLGGTYIPTTADQKVKDWHGTLSWRDDGWMPSANSC